VDDPALFIHLRSMHVPNTSNEIQTNATDKQVESVVPSRKSNRKSILALSVFALGLNASAAVYTLSPSDFVLPNVGSLAELFPHERASAPIPEVVVAALNDIQSAQQHNAVALQDHGSLLQQNAALLQQDSAKLDGLRQTLTDEQSDVKKISVQLSTLIAKVDSLQSAIAPDVTSSIRKGRARNRLSGMAQKRMARPHKPTGPISVGGVPPTTAPVQGWTSLQSPEG
jgi:uncharacterized coiled-coil protein SlyX